MSSTTDDVTEIEIVRLREKIKEFDQQIQDITNRINEKAEERNRANQEMKEIKERVKSLKAEKESVLKEAEREREELRKHRREMLSIILETKNVKNELRGIRLPSDISEVKKKLDEIDYYLSAHRVGRAEEKRLFEQASKLEALLREYERVLKLKSQLAEISPELERLRQIIEEKKSILDGYNSKINAIKEELKTINARYDELKVIANDAHAEYVRLKEELMKLEAERLLAVSKLHELRQLIKGRREERFQRKVLELREKMKREAQEKVAKGKKVGFEELKVLLEEDPSWFLENVR
ncbi:MAG: hypothetical protein RMJ06_00195 [Nitrososphaerota archaeon]|nr:hypothetical protein [Nitrososphaerota archaeon]